MGYTEEDLTFFDEIICSKVNKIKCFVILCIKRKLHNNLKVNEEWDNENHLLVKTCSDNCLYDGYKDVMKNVLVKVRVG